jgi:hypothetical protein
MAINIEKMTLPELLTHIGDLPAAKKASALKQIANLTPELKTVLKYTFHKNIMFELPKGAPPYKEMETPENWGHNRLPRELRKFQYFITGNNLNPIKREAMFIEVLESVSPEEAKLVLMMKEKKLTYKGITRKLIEEALPEILQGESE